MLSTTASPSSTVGTRCGGPPQNQRRSPWTRPPLALSRPVASPPRRGLPKSVFDMVDRAACGRSATCDHRSCPRSLSLRGQACHSAADGDAALAMRQQAERVHNIRRRCGSLPMSSRSIRTNVSLSCTHSRQGCFTYALFTSNSGYLHTNKLVRIVSPIYCTIFCDVAT